MFFWLYLIHIKFLQSYILWKNYEYIYKKIYKRWIFIRTPPKNRKLAWKYWPHKIICLILVGKSMVYEPKKAKNKSSWSPPRLQSWQRLSLQTRPQLQAHKQNNTRTKSSTFVLRVAVFMWRKPYKSLLHNSQSLTLLSIS